MGPDATFNIGPETLDGKAQIRKFFATKAGAFKPENHWVSETPAYKIRMTVDGDKGTLYFECHYVDIKTEKVVSTSVPTRTCRRSTEVADHELGRGAGGSRLMS